MLFYMKLWKELKKSGFTCNSYDPQVANAIVKGSKMIIIWHVHDLKISHKNQRAVVQMIKYMEGICGNLTISPHKTHDYPSMNLDSSGKEKVKTLMNKYT